MPTLDRCFVLCLTLRDRSLNHLVKDGKPIDVSVSVDGYGV